VRVRVRKLTLRINLQVHSDPRVLRYEISRGTTVVCRTRTGVCTLRHVKPGTYRFTAIAVDEWAQSTPTLSAKVVVRRRR
jgi:hypothetical protein